MSDPRNIVAKAPGNSLGWAITLFTASALFGGCARFQSKPLNPEQTASAFEARTLQDPELQEMIRTHLPQKFDDGRVISWDLDTLTLAAFRFHPDLDLARAKFRTAQSGTLTAAMRPNPNLAFTPRLNETSLGTAVNPWILGGLLDIPLETMGKRKYRVAHAQHLSEVARLDIANTAWTIRDGVRNSFLALQAAEASAALLHEQIETLSEVARLVERQWRAGAVSPLELSRSRIGQQNAELKRMEVERQAAEAHAQLAAAIGVPLPALEKVSFTFPDLGAFPTNLVSGALQRQAVLNRADVLRALTEYAASESALQLEIARQYPDIHWRPGYELDQNKNKWTLGLSVDLPILHQNQGPIAEAEAKREEAAARFFVVQSRVIEEITRARNIYFAALEQVVAAGSMLANIEQRRTAVTRMYEAGEVSRLEVVTAQAEYLDGALARLKARLQAQQALASLEQAMQSPVLMPVQPVQLETVSSNASEPGKL